MNPSRAFVLKLLVDIENENDINDIEVGYGFLWKVFISHCNQQEMNFIMLFSVFSVKEEKSSLIQIYATRSMFLSIKRLRELINSI